MENINTAYLRRALRLQTYLAPYPQYTFQLNEEISEPIRITIISRRDNTRFNSEIYAPLLETDAPDWLEINVLKYLRHLEANYWQSRENFDASQIQHEALDQLNNYFSEKYALSKIDYDSSDKNELLLTLWQKLIRQYFPEEAELHSYKISWSKRNQRSSLASCNVERKRVEVAHVMSQAECLPYLEPLIYHEMCHAALGKPKIVNGRRVMHGKDFKQLEKRHPQIPELNSWIHSGGWHQAVQACSS